MSHYLSEVRFTKDWRCFKEGDIVTFQSGLNFLVGDQGSGKSSLLQAIQGCKYPQAKDAVECTVLKNAKSHAFDFEQDNYRIKSYFDDNIDFQLYSMYKSHGEVNLTMLELLNQAEEAILFLDEPDCALSIRSVIELHKILKGTVKRGCQVIASVHNPVLINLAGPVFSLDHRKWMKGSNFVSELLGEYNG